MIPSTSQLTPRLLLGTLLLAITAASSLADTVVPTTQDENVDPMLAARILEEVEGDLAAAVKIYRKEADNILISEHARRRARLRLGLCLARLGQSDESREALTRVAEGNDILAERARTALSGTVEADQRLRGHVKRLLDEYLNTHRGDVDSHAEDLRFIGGPALPQIFERLDQEVSLIEVSKRLAGLIVSIDHPQVVDFLRKQLEGQDVFLRRLFLQELWTEAVSWSNKGAYWYARPYLEPNERARLANSIVRNLDRDQLLTLLTDGNPSELRTALIEGIARKSLIEDDRFRPALIHAWFDELRRLGRSMSRSPIAMQYWNQLSTSEYLRYPEVRSAYVEFLMDPQNASPRAPLGKPGSTQANILLGENNHLRASEVLQIAKYWSATAERRALAWPKLILNRLCEFSSYWDRDEIADAVSITLLLPDSYLGHRLQDFVYDNPPKSELLRLAGVHPETVQDAMWNRNAHDDFLTAVEMLPKDYSGSDKPNLVMIHRLIQLHNPRSQRLLIGFWESERFRPQIRDAYRSGSTPFLRWLARQDRALTGEIFEVLAYRDVEFVDEIPLLLDPRYELDNPLGHLSEMQTEHEEFDPSRWQTALLPTLAAVSDKTRSPEWHELWRRAFVHGADWMAEFPELHRSALLLGLESSDSIAHRWALLAAVSSKSPLGDKKRNDAVRTVARHPELLKAGLRSILRNRSIDPALRSEVVETVVNQPSPSLLSQVIGLRRVTPLDQSQIARLVRHPEPKIRLMSLDELWADLENPTDEGAVPPLVLERLSDPSEAVRSLALGLTWKLDRDTSRVIHALRDPSPRVRKTALFILEGYPEPASAEELVRLLRDPDSEVRDLTGVVLQALESYEQKRDRWIERSRKAKLEYESALTALIGQMQASNPKELRLAAIRSAPAMGRPELLPFVIELIRDTDTDIRQAALESVDMIRMANRK